MNAAIFDMDGLLLDTEPLWGRCMLEVAKSHRINVSMPQLRYTTGLRIYEVTAFWKDQFEWGTSASADTVADEILDAIIAASKQEARVMTGVTDCLEWMQKEEIKLGLATSSPARMMNDLVQHFGLTNYFNVLTSADTALYGKPHPEVYLQCAHALNTPSYNCIAIEDSVNGMIAAKAARMKVVVVPDQLKYNDKRFGLADLKLNSLAHFTKQEWDHLLSD